MMKEYVHQGNQVGNVPEIESFYVVSLYDPKKGTIQHMHKSRLSLSYWTRIALLLIEQSVTHILLLLHIIQLRENLNITVLWDTLVPVIQEKWNTRSLRSVPLGHPQPPIASQIIEFYMLPTNMAVKVHLAYLSDNFPDPLGGAYCAIQQIRRNLPNGNNDEIDFTFPPNDPPRVAVYDERLTYVRILLMVMRGFARFLISREYWG
jgi:hypothetical protein